MNEDSRRRLEDLLDREIDIARVLAATLDAERSALTGASPEAVQQKAAEKRSFSEPSKGSRTNAAL